MTRSRPLPERVSRIGASLLLGLLPALVAIVPASAQEEDEAPPPAASEEITPLITVQTLPVVPSAPPPAPPGELRQLPALYNEPVGPFAMYMEIVTAGGPSEYGLLASPGCILDGIFKRGMRLVWRFEVYDLETGLRVTDREGARAEVLLPDGATIPAAFTARGGPTAPPDAPWTWVAAWTIPPDHPLGPVDYAVTVSTVDGRTSTLRPSSIGSRYPQVVE